VLGVKRRTYLSAAEAWYATRGLAPVVREQRRTQRRLYREFVRPGDICFDVGAHIGDRTRCFLDLGAHVVAIEPQPSCVERLEFVFGRNPRVKLIREALGATPGEGELAICDQAPTISSMSRGFRESGRFAGQHQWTRTVRVAVTTLDLLIDQYGVPSFCKIDVEGFELEVIRGLTHAIPALSFEFGWDTLAQTRACLKYLARIAPCRVNYSLGESMVWALPNWVEPDALVDHLTDLTQSKLVGGDIYVRMGQPVAT
jgi:FkbM family methyltransferase